MSDPAALLKRARDLFQQGLPARKTYDVWRMEKFSSTTSPASQPTADPDGDGMTNFAEYAFNTNPTAGNASPQSSGMTVIGGQICAAIGESSNPTSDRSVGTSTPRSRAA